MLGITDLPTYLIGTVVVILLPGPNSLFVLAIASRQGVRDAYEAVAGVMVGDSILMVASAAGMAPIIAAHPLVFTILKTGGALYLAYLGLGLLRSAWHSWRTHSTIADIPTPPRVQNPFKRTVTICLLNPKAILFFISFFIQFVDPQYPHPALSFVVLGAMLQAISFCYLSTLIFAGSRLAAAFRARRRLAAGATGGAGLLFIGFGARLAAP